MLAGMASASSIPRSRLETLAQKVVVEFEDRRKTVVGRDDILGVEKSKTRSLKDEDEDGVEQ